SQNRNPYLWCLVMPFARATSALTGDDRVAAPAGLNEADDRRPSAASTAELRHESVNQCLDIAVAIGEGDAGGGAAVDPRHVVGHQHVGVADIAVDAERAGHVHVAFVRERFHKVELASFDVAEMHVEDLAPRAEPADYVEDLAGRVVEHLGHRTLTE